MKVVLDAGHSTSECGAVNSALQMTEAEYTWEIVQAITRNLKGYEVIFTPRDRYSSERAKWATQQGGDLLVSVHLNAGSSTAQGYELYYHHGNEEGLKLANAIAQAYAQTGLKFRGVIDDYYWRPADNPTWTGGLGILANFSKAGTLIEALFISNPNEAVLLKNSEFVNKIGRCIAMGINNYATSNLFPDLPPSDIRDAVIDLYQRQLIKGYPDGTYRPDEPVTRGQIAVLLRRLLYYLGKEG